MARLYTGWLLVLVLGVALQAQAPAGADFERLFGRALELQQAGDTLGAIDNYKAALALDPNRVDALSNLGAAYVRLGQFEDAIAQYQHALTLQPANSAVRLNLGLAYYKSARPNDAIPELQQVVASDPNARNAYLVLADCYLQNGQDAEIVALLGPREQMFGNDLAYAYLLGTALLHTGNEADGQKYVDRIFGAGESAEGHLLMALAYLKRLDYPNAKTELERAVRLNPKLPTVNGLYGRSLLGVGDQEAAAVAFRRELEVNVNDFEANLQLGNLKKNAHQLEDALAYLNRAVSIRPRDITARRLLASVKLQSGSVEDAAAMFEQIVKEAPDLIEAHVQLATAYNRLKRREDAERERAIAERLTAEAQARQPGAVAADANATDSRPEMPPEPPADPSAAGPPR